MKGLRKNSFKNFGLTLVQISLIAGSIALGINSNACSKSVTNLKTNCHLNCQYKSFSSDFYLFDNIAQSVNSAKLISFTVSSATISKFITLDPDLSLKSGLSPPVFLV